MQGSFVVNFGGPSYAPPPQPQVVFSVGAPVMNNGGAFYVVSRMNGLVLDVEGGSRNQGTHFFIFFFLRFLFGVLLILRCEIWLENCLHPIFF